MSNHFALRAALLLATLGAAPLSAQTAPPTRGSHPIPTPVLPGQSLRNVKPLQVAKPFQQSLLVSSDGVHWAQTATVTYTNPCAHGGPASCGVLPPRFTMYASWNPSIPAAQMVGLSVNPTSYYAFMVPGNYMCFDVAQMHIIAGDMTTSHATFGGPLPNSATSYSCTYQVAAKVNQNGSIQQILTNPVTVNVNVVQATP